MKRRTALLVGLAAGYVLGARAGRERYEQIRRIFNSVWKAKPVVKYRASAKVFVGDKVSDAQDFVVKKGKSFLHAVTDPSRDS